MRIRGKWLCILLCFVVILSGCKRWEDPVTWVPTTSTSPTEPVTEPITKPEPEPEPEPEPKPLPEKYATSIAHQGGRGYGYPQNTLENIIACAQDGWKLVEFDVRWTADGVPVISHDDERKIYGSEEKISIAASTYEELKAVRLYENETIRIATFYEVIDACKQYGLRACIEFKANPKAQQLDEMMDYLRKADMLRSCAWLCFNLDPLLNVTKRDPQATVMLCLSKAPELSWLTTETRMGKLLNREGETVLSYNYKSLSSMEDPDAYLNGFKNAGCRIGLWTIDDPEIICRYAEIADYITSNNYTVPEAWGK